jgi:hypothetical protein
MLVNVKNRIPTVIINTEPNPYPQLLVTQWNKWVIQKKPQFN